MELHIKQPARNLEGIASSYIGSCSNFQSEGPTFTNELLFARVETWIGVIHCVHSNSMGEGALSDGDFN